MIDQPTKMSQFGGLEKWPMPCPLFVDPTMVLVCHEGRLVHCRTSGTHTKNDGKSPCSMGKSTINGPCSSSFKFANDYSSHYQRLI